MRFIVYRDNKPDIEVEADRVVFTNETAEFCRGALRKVVITLDDKTIVRGGEQLPALDD